ncbi:MAG: hypothetical protein Q7V63_07555 [Gammaproteobacteria bacterium]|nr:hypothetical protein [Gammaproteobacteria bacterium]
MKGQGNDSLGIELSNNKLKAVWIQRSEKRCRIMAKSIHCLMGPPVKSIRALIADLSKGAPQLQLARLPTYMSLSGPLVNRCTLNIEGDILRLRPYVIDDYIFARAIESIERPLDEIFLEYYIVQSKISDAEHTEVMIVWVEKSQVQPYLLALKSYRLNVKALELAEHSNHRFMTKTMSTLPEEMDSEFSICCGAALREWEAEDV